MGIKNETVLDPGSCSLEISRLWRPKGEERDVARTRTIWQACIMPPCLRSNRALRAIWVHLVWRILGNATETFFSTRP